MSESEIDRFTEETIREGALSIFTEVMEIEVIDLESDLFSMGGNSMHAVMIQIRVRERLNIDIPIDIFFESRSIGGLIDEIEAAFVTRTTEPKKASEHRKADQSKAALLSDEQEYLWEIIRSGKIKLDNLHVRQRLDVYGNLNISALLRSIEDVFQRHEILKARITVLNGAPIQIIEGGRKLVVESRDITGSENPELDIDKAIEEVIWKPFDIESDHLVRACILRVSKTQNTLLLVLHHMVCDRWSIDILAREISKLYNALVDNKLPDLMGMPLQFSDYIYRMRGRDAEKSTQDSIRYWRETLGGAPAPIRLTSDSPAQSKQVSQASCVAMSIPAPLVNNLMTAGRRDGVTLFMVLLAAYQSVISKWSGVFDVSVYSVVSGRNDSEAEMLVGTFAKTLIFRTKVHKDSSFLEHLNAAKATCLGAFRHQGVSPLNFDILKSRGGVPLSMVSFQLRNYAKSSWALKETRIEERELKPSVSERSSLGNMLLIFDTGPDGLNGELTYPTKLFKAETMQRFVTDFIDILTDYSVVDSGYVSSISPK